VTYVMVETTSRLLEYVYALAKERIEVLEKDDRFGDGWREVSPVQLFM
jgi:hypothetical protein